MIVSRFHIQIVKLESQQLQTSHPGGVKGFQSCPVPDPQWIAQVDVVNDSIGFACGQDALRQPFFELGKLQFAGWIVNSLHHLDKVAQVNSAARNGALRVIAHRQRF
jgi:hypothetical protein